MEYSDDTDAEQIFDLFAEEEIALAQARTQLAWHEHRLAELVKAYPEFAALRQTAQEITLTDLRSEELSTALTRINSALNLTGEETDYWLRLWDHALANFGVTEDQFDDMTRERLAAIVEAGLLTTPKVPQPEDLRAIPEPAPAVVQPVTQPRQRWSRSRKPGTSRLYELVRAMKVEGISQLGMCERLDAQKSNMPDLVGWRDLTWRTAYLSPKHGGAVRKWLSKATAVTR